MWIKNKQMNRFSSRSQQASNIVWVLLSLIQRCLGPPASYPTLFGSSWVLSIVVWVLLRLIQRCLGLLRLIQCCLCPPASYPTLFGSSWVLANVVWVLLRLIQHCLGPPESYPTQHKLQKLNQAWKEHPWIRNCYSTCMMRYLNQILQINVR
jgi:hypothetical protein